MGGSGSVVHSMQKKANSGLDVILCAYLDLVCRQSIKHRKSKASLKVADININY